MDSDVGSYPSHMQVVGHTNNPTSSSGGGGQCGWEYIEHYDLEIGYYEEIVPPAYYAWRR